MTPNLRGLPADQVLLAKASWAIFLVLQLKPALQWPVDQNMPDVQQPDRELYAVAMGGLEWHMQPETLHRLALCRGAWFRRDVKEKAEEAEA
jgi:hypothetical protein